ncbi:MAG: carbohydrate kinase family protein [Chloroflexi bacterium]|nr:carbohydrate kinase family protein [Chloroflexota bacterium]
MQPDVVCLGLATFDTIAVLPSWPTPDGRLIAEQVVRSGGGTAATAAVTIARLGSSVALVGAVGDDANGEPARAALAASGVDVGHLHSLPGRTAESVVLVDRSAGTRSILHLPGVALSTLDDASRRMAESASWVHVDHVGYPLAADLDPARLSTDAGNRTAELRLHGLGLYAPTADALGDRFPGCTLREAIRMALDEGAHRVVVTLGGDGAIGADGGGAWRVAAARTQVASTLGAGDVFHGSIVASLAAGQSLPDAMRRANVAAALSCRSIDARGSIPTLPELTAALASAPPVEPIVLEQA